MHLFISVFSKMICKNFTSQLDTTLKGILGFPCAKKIVQVLGLQDGKMEKNKFPTIDILLSHWNWFSPCVLDGQNGTHLKNDHEKPRATNKPCQCPDMG